MAKFSSTTATRKAKLVLVMVEAICGPWIRVRPPAYCHEIIEVDDPQTFLDGSTSLTTCKDHEKQICKTLFGSWIYFACIY